MTPILQYDSYPMQYDSYPGNSTPFKSLNGRATLNSIPLITIHSIWYLFCVMKLLPLLLPAIALCFTLQDKNFKYVDYYPGSQDTNVILTAPHDGWIKLDSIPDRRQVGGPLHFKLSSNFAVNWAFEVLRHQD